MRLNILHGGRPERLTNIHEQLEVQGIEDYEIWSGLHDKNSIVRTINISHKQIVEYSQLKGDEMVCIAEDDFLMTHPDSFAYYIKNIPASFDVYLGGCYIPDIRNGKLVSWAGLHLYTVHKNFYETFLSLPEHEHLDRAMAGLGEFHLCNPMVAIQANGFSSNTGKEENYSHLLNGASLYKGY